MSVNISVFGIGYVGVVSAACLARDGHRVVAVDVNPEKVKTLGQGNSPIVEPGLDELIREVVKTGKLRSSLDASDAIASSDISFICVGTPSLPNGSLDATYVSRVAAQIGRALRDKDNFHFVVMRSTILPGTSGPRANKPGVFVCALARRMGLK